MKRMKWFATLSVAMVLIACAAIFTKAPVKGAEGTESKDTFIFEQLGDAKYTQNVGGYDLLANEDLTKYLAITGDGQTYNIDNSSKAYAKVEAITGTSFYNTLVVTDAEGKKSFMTLDGGTYGNSNASHDGIGFLENNIDGAYSGYYWTQDGSKVTVYNKTGEAVYVKEDVSASVNMIKFIDNYAYIEDTAGGWGFYHRENGTKILEDNGIPTLITESYIEYYNRNSEVQLILIDINNNPITQEEFDKEYTAMAYEKYPEFGTYINKADYEKYPLVEGCVDAWLTTVAGESFLVERTPATTGYQLDLYNMSGECVLKNLTSSFHYSGIFIVHEEGEYKAIRMAKRAAASEVVLTPQEDGTIQTDIAVTNPDDTTSETEEIAVVVPANVVPANAKLTISKVTSGTEFDTAKQVVSAVVNKVSMYNIDLLDTSNYKIQPNGYIKFTIPLPSDYNTEYVKVYRIDDTSYTEILCKVVDGKVEFETNHFSTYIIAEAIPETVASTEADSETPETSDATATAGEYPVMMLVVLAVVAVAVFVVAAYAIKKKSAM